MQWLNRLADAVQITFYMEYLARPLDHLEMLVEAPRLRLSLYRSADDRKGAPYPARRIAQAGYDSENLILAQAGLAEQAFLYMDMNDPHSAMRALDKQEQFCRRLGDPERLAVCLINNAVVGGRDRRTGLAKPKEAQAPGQGLARWGYRDLTGIKKCDAIPRRERQR